MTLNVEFNNVSVDYKKFSALHDITCRLEGGKIYGLIGRNGAGKSTLLSLLASYREPTGGNLRVAGEDPFENTSIMAQVSFIYEFDYSDESEKVKGMLEAASRYRPHFDIDYAMELVERFNLPLDKPIKNLSNGMQSSLNVTLGLADRSPITIFDEAYLGMDAPTREIFYKEVLEDHARHPRTMILSTHLVSEMDYLFEEVIMIHKGKLLLHKPYDELIERGASITGASLQVDEFVRNLTQLNNQQLGDTKSVMVYGDLSEEKRDEAKKKGLDVGPVSLQDLFIHLTSEEV
ncbi:ATP-binding cassette domain-containing protein [Halobacillus seohaensis]|uniref:ATP-binding cassette domain-containing protein n=1 Tax=Halobacillus seohaensis TaxID=447421 RepID=A0ABW2ES41_9BACI